MSAWGKSTLIKLELYAFMGLSAGRLGVPIWSTVQAKSRNGCSLKTKKIGTSIWTLKSGYRWLAAAGCWLLSKLTMGSCKKIDNGSSEGRKHNNVFISLILLPPPLVYLTLSLSFVLSPVITSTYLQFSTFSLSLSVPSFDNLFHFNTYSWSTQ